jgi:hypothetical protein
MDFYEVVRQAAALLQQHGKLTYRTLRRQFALDDATLEDLKEELPRRPGDQHQRTGARCTDRRRGSRG